jgi:hypothetical protein
VSRSSNGLQEVCYEVNKSVALLWLLGSLGVGIIGYDQGRDFGRAGQADNYRTAGNPMRLAEFDGDGWLDADDPLSDEEKALLETRLADMERHPEKSIPWEEAKRRIEDRFGR